MASETELNTNIANNSAMPEAKTVVERKPRTVLSRINILIRRIHLYSGLFLLPWVIMYGVTGAMFNHQGLFPRIIGAFVIGISLLTATAMWFGLQGYYAATRL